MPAADISQVQVTFGNGIKREEYGPLKKAEVTIIAIVNTGEDGVVALNYISNIAQAKVRDLLTIQGSAPAAAPATGEIQGDPGGAPGEPQRRHRRTKAEIEADELKAAQAVEAANNTSGSATPASADTPAPKDHTPPELSPQSESGSTAADDGDEWGAAAPEEISISDVELNSTCSATAQRLGEGGALKVKGTIVQFSPGGDAFDPAKPGGRKFTVNDIPQNQRASFLAKLRALSN